MADILPAPVVALPEWPEESLTAWADLTRRAQQLRDRLGQGPELHDLLARVRALIDMREWERLRSLTGQRPFARALVTVWRDDPDRMNASLTPETLSAVMTNQGDRPSRLLLSSLLSVLLSHFDNFGREIFDALGNAIREGVQQLSDRSDARLAGALGSVARHPNLILDLGGPYRIAQEIAETHSTADSWLSEHGLRGFDTGRFGLRVRQEVYLRQIDRSDPSGAGSLGFLDQLRAEEILRAPGSDGRHFGHDVLEYLARRPDSQPCSKWIETVLAIAGDPRLRHTRKWREWWQPLEASVRETVVAWLSKNELELFLGSIENFGHETGDEAQVRMYKDRKLFLEGLLDHGIVRETRLLMGSQVRHWVRGQLADIPADIALYRTGTTQSIIIMDCGNFQLIEGSHNFSLRLYAGGPFPILHKRAERSFSRTDVVTQIDREHERRNRLGPNACDAIEHRGLWQRRALSFIVERIGVELRVEDLLEPGQYTKLIWSLGLPVIGSRLLKETS